jgi:hypothetical protein
MNAAADEARSPEVAALEKAGVEFIDEDGGGPGVRLKPPKTKRKPK